jgi:hypothetical protein
VTGDHAADLAGVNLAAELLVERLVSPANPERQLRVGIKASGHALLVDEDKPAIGKHHQISVENERGLDRFGVD